MNHRIQTVTFAILLGASGCSIPYAEDGLQARNLCSADSDCAEGSSCATVGDESTCVAGAVDLEGLIFEVRPVLGKGETSSSSVLLTPGPLKAAGGGQVVNLDLEVPPYVDVAPGQVFLPCAGDTPVPARVTFLPAPGLLGLLQGQKYESAATLDQAGNEAFEASVPPGAYDLYLQPQPDLVATPGCAVAPPIFLRKQALSRDVGLSVHAAEPLLLTGTLKLSQKEDFTKWFLEVVEPFGGQTISAGAIQPQQEGIALVVPFELWFDWTARTDFTPIVRLRPPEGSGKPVIHWSLDAAALEGIKGNQVPVQLDVSGIDTQPRQVGGQVLHDGDSVPATVTLRSLMIGGSKLNHYETVVETDDAGHFESAVPPGTYSVIARPHAPGLAVGQATWDVVKAADCYCGKSVEAPSATTVAGQAVTPSGEPAMVEVRLTPSATGGLTYLAKLVAPDVQPRPASTVTDDGDFQVPVDAGLSNLTIAPAPGWGYPWLVRTQLLVSKVGAQAAPVMSVGKLALQSPVVVRGRVTGAGGFAMSGATLRAWIPVAGADPTAAPSAVPIGEAVADVNGEYFLLLPPSIK